MILGLIDPKLQTPTTFDLSGVPDGKYGALGGAPPLRRLSFISIAFTKNARAVSITRLWCLGDSQPLSALAGTHVSLWLVRFVTERGPATESNAKKASTRRSGGAQARRQGATLRDRRGRGENRPGEDRGHREAQGALHLLDRVPEIGFRPRHGGPEDPRIDFRKKSEILLELDPFR